MSFRPLLRSFTRTIPRILPRALPPTKTPRPHFFSQTSRTLRPPPPPRRMRISSNRYYESEIQNAKPLITPEALAALVRNPRFHVFLAVAAGGVVVFYYSNIETVPVSGRRRFNCYSDESVEAEGKRAYNAVMNGMHGDILPEWDARHKMVMRVMKRLIPASGIEDADWEVHVIQSRDANAFVIPGGKVFVLTGILPIALNDDGLAAILGHEIAHNVARHSAEAMSRMILFTPIRWILMALDSSGLTMGFGHILASIGMDLGITRPASRLQESEADFIGLMMMAKSCYNPEEAVRVWERMEKFMEQQDHTPDWLSTHPSNTQRIGQMKGWLAQAEEARLQGDCANTIAYSNSFRNAVQSLLFR